MHNLRLQKNLQDGLSPWRVKHSSDQDKQIDQFCYQALPKLFQQQTLYCKINNQFTRNNLDTPAARSRSRRPISNVANLRETVESKNIFDRLTGNPHRQVLKSHQKTSREENKQTLQPLQELSVRNYIIQGSCSGSKDSLCKKKQSSYVMKQKFAQIRRSMNLQLGIWGSVNKPHHQGGRYEDKENAILRSIKYEFN